MGCEKNVSVMEISEEKDPDDRKGLANPFSYFVQYIVDK